MRLTEGARAKLRASTAPWGQNGALVMGLTIGDTGDIDESMIEAFRRAGLSHLVAVSGSNLAIFLGALTLVFRKLDHKVRVAAAGVAIVLFVLIVGPQPSVLRAAAMGAVAVAAMGWGRTTEPLLALGLGVLAVIVWRPGLVYSVGLQLSAVATAGIVLWTKPLSDRFAWMPAPIRVALAATLSAQLAVAPLLVATFGQLSLIAPLANLLAFPAVAPATILGISGGALQALNGALGMEAGHLAALSASWILFVAARLGELPWASIELPRWAGFLLGVPVAALAVLTLSRLSEASRTLAPMSEYVWVVQDEAGKELRTTETFPSQAEAESWMGSVWSGLADEGGAFVVLKTGDETVYRMSLAEA
jgi:competence protein ComEC